MFETLKKLSFRSRLWLLMFVFLLGSVAQYAINRKMLNAVQVNGPLYQRIAQGKDIVADILPPPEYVVESYLVVLQLTQEESATKREELVARLSQLESEYVARHDYWNKQLEDGSLKKSLVTDSYGPAKAFYEAINRNLLPALKGNVTEADLKKIVRDEVQSRYEQHRRAIDETVKLANARIVEDEQHGRATISDWQTTQFIAGLVTIAVVMFVTWRIGQGIVIPTNRMIDRVADMADGAADLTKRVQVDGEDEISRLGKLVNAVIQRIHDLIVRVRVSTIQLHSTSTEIAAAASEQSNTMQSFNASTSQIAAAVKEITATGQELVRTMDEVQGHASGAAQLADAGRVGLIGMENSMHRLGEATNAISQKLGTIRDKASGINVVVTTITKVADQTNLLSINAAIEAEKAGEAGRGFLVVAREIRRLADQTAVATLDIDQMVRHMQSAVSSGVMEMDKFSDEVRQCGTKVVEISGQMAQVIEQVQTVSERFLSVNEAMRQQSLGARQIDEAMLQLINGCRQVTTTVRDFTAAATNLRESAQTLQQEIGRFTVSG